MCLDARGHGSIINAYIMYAVGLSVAAAAAAAANSDLAAYGWHYAYYVIAKSFCMRLGLGDYIAHCNFADLNDNMVCGFRFC